MPGPHGGPYGGPPGHGHGRPDSPRGGGGKMCCGCLIFYLSYFFLVLADSQMSCYYLY